MINLFLFWKKKIEKASQKNGSINITMNNLEHTILLILLKLNLIHGF